MKQKFKKVLSVLSTFATMIAAMPAVEIPANTVISAASTVLYGDINGDFVIDSSDTSALTKAINNKTASTLKNADLNADGKIDNSDAQLLSQFVSGEIEYFPVGDYYDANAGYITRSEWIHTLVTTFDMSVDDTSTVTKYYTDLSGNKYENDINLAANFGVFEINGENFEPDGKVTREFAAHTANFCIGYKNQTQADSYADYDDIYYVDDAAVAVEKNWFALVENQFRSDMYMKSAESKKIVSDLNEALNVQEIDETAEQVIEYKDNVIRLNSSVNASQSGSIITINDKNNIAKGDVFTVYIDGSEGLYKAVSVSKGKNGEAIIQTESPSIDEAIEKINIQGYASVDSDDIIYYKDDTPTVQSYSIDSPVILPNQYSLYSAENSGIVNIHPVDLNKKISIDDVTVALSGKLDNITAEYKLAYDGSITNIQNLYFNVNADANVSVKLSSSFDSTKSKEVKIASVPVPIGPFSIEMGVYATVSISGETTLSYKCDLGGGISYTKKDGWRTTKSFHSKGFTLEANVNLTAAIKAAISLNLTKVKLVEYYIQVGAIGNMNGKTREDGTACATLKAHMFAEIGANTCLDKMWNTLFGSPLVGSFKFIDENNSPVKLLKHWENGKLVSTCKYEKLSNGSTGLATVKHVRNYGDYTRYGSNFEGLITSDEPVLQDYEINSTLNLEGDMTINGNAIITADVNLNGYTLTVTGNITQTGGGMYPYGGTLNVGGNYEISSDGHLYMYSSNGGEVNISKDFIIKSNKECRDSYNYNCFRYGTLSIGDNFYQYNNGTVTGNFKQDGTKVTFTGSGIHEIHFDSTNSYFTDISSTGDSQFKFTGRMPGFQLNNDMTFVGDTKLDAGTLHLGSHHLTIEGNFTQNGNVNLWNGSLDINGNHIINGTLSNSGELDSILNVENDIEMTSGTINLSEITMNITGDVTQTGGIMNPYGGTLNVGGNYEISSDGYLSMYSSLGGEVNISKDFIIKSNKECRDSYNYNCFRYGTLSIGGNFYQYNNGTVTGNFKQDGTKVTFTGSGIHEIHFDSQNSWLNDIAMDNGSSISFEWGNKKLNNLFANGSQILSISSNTVKAVKVGDTKLTVNYNDGSKSDINIVVNKSDYVEDPPKVTTAVTTKPVTISTTTVKTTTTVPPTTTAPTNSLGDVNGDNKISVADIVLLQRYLVKKVKFTDVQWKLADLNSDGKVNVFDVCILKRKLLK